MKVKISILFIACTVVLFSCKKDMLDKMPDGVLTKEQAFKDPNMARGVLSNCYTHVPLYFDAFHEYNMLASMCDEGVNADGGIVGGNWNRGLISLTFDPFYYSDGGLLKVRLWSGIRKANLFLDNIDLTPVSDNPSGGSITPMQKKQWIAEAKLLRAFFHAELMRMYGGIAISDFAYPPSFDFASLKRNSYDECASWVAAQCDAVMADLPVRRKQSGDFQEIGFNRGTKMIALALKARTLLYNASPLNNPENDRKKWQDAADASKKVLEMAASTGEYKLYYSDQPANGAKNTYELFKLQDNGTASMSEVIWQRPENNGVFTTTNSIKSAGGYKGGLNPSQELVDAFETISGEPPILGYSDNDHLQPIYNPEATDYNPLEPYANRDPRLTGSVFYNGAYWGRKGATDYWVQIYVGGADQIAPDRNSTSSGYYIKKFVDPTRGNGASGNGTPSGQAYWPIFRLAEFYLSFAEADNEANGPSQAAIDAINAIRTRAGMPGLKPKFSLNKELFRARIRNERRIELAFEEHRFFDVRRWKIIDKTDKLVTGMRIIKNGAVYSYERFVVENRNAWQEKFLYFPFSADEMTKMPQYGQNFGW